MKKFATLVLIMLLALGACKKNDSVSVNITTDEAASLMASSLSTNTNGFITASADIMVNSQSVYDLNIACGSSKTYTATHQSTAGATPAYNNTFAYTYTLNCNTNNLPDNVTGTAADNGSFDGPNLSSTNAGTATFRVAGLVPTSAAYVVNGEYKRTGTFALKVGSKSTGTTTVDIVISNLVINKTSKVVLSGTATFTVTGSTTNRSNFNYSGNITFTGNGTAAVTISGSVYVIDLITGTVTKK